MKTRAEDKKLLDYGTKWFPGSVEWMIRRIQEIKVDLKAANITVILDKDGNGRWIIFKKTIAKNTDTYNT